jgi:ABC-type multidrug transport system ATPase subunit
MANNVAYDGETFATFASYVMQNDVLLETLTPREAFQFIANLKFKNEKEKSDRVNDTIRTLKLDRC